MKDIVNLAMGSLATWIMVMSVVGGNYALKEGNWKESCFWASMFYVSGVSVVKSTTRILED